jgi:hypothetical protein
MKMHKWLMRFTKNKPMRLIEINGDPYLERYHIASIFGFKIWLHRFVRKDSERHLHNHAWGALSLILNGGYREVVALDGYRNMDIIDYKRGQINFIRASKAHRILAVEPNTWTLFIRAPRLTDYWFFIDDEGKWSPMKSAGDEWQNHALTRPEIYTNRATWEN